jgi:RNA polymerase sigma factor (sigma-70 family)
MDRMSDNALMMEVKDGDLEKLGLLFERYQRRLFGFFYRLTLRRDISEDLVQNVFERILKYRGTFSDENSFSSWIFSIARNLHSDHCRKTNKMHYGSENGETNWELIPAGDPEPQSHIETDNGKDLVHQALNRLDPEKKQVLILSRIEGFKYREIAVIMNCTESAVKVRVFRALSEIRTIINNIGTQENQ